MYWWTVGTNENILMDHVAMYPNLPWNYHSLCRNPNVTIDFVLKYQDKLSNHATSNAIFTSLRGPERTMDWAYLTKSIHVRDILLHPELPWLYRFMSENQTLCMQDVLDYPDLFNDWMDLSANRGITMDDIRNHPDLPWCFEFVSRNGNLTMRFILDHPDKPWSWPDICQNSAIGFQNVIRHPELPWDMESICAHQHITIRDVSANVNVNWSWSDLTANPGIMIKDVLDNSTMPWNWQSIINNPNMTMEYVLLFNLDLTNKRTCRIVSNCPGILLSDIHRYSHLPWDMTAVLTNAFTRERLNYAYHHMMAFRIQLYWRKCIKVPSFAMCERIQNRRRLQL